MHARSTQLRAAHEDGQGSSDQRHHLWSAVAGILPCLPPARSFTLLESTTRLESITIYITGCSQLKRFETLLLSFTVQHLPSITASASREASLHALPDRCGRDQEDHVAMCTTWKATQTAKQNARLNSRTSSPGLSSKGTAQLPLRHRHSANRKAPQARRGDSSRNSLSTTSTAGQGPR